ncbi:MAG: hypothetical protein M1338_02585 [Patescibacteria group bacterium]|nr:hypothetical protein [Patescibacteria group bacterium]
MFLVFIFSAVLKTTILKTDYYLSNLKKVDAYNRLINDGIPSLILDTKISDNQLTDSFAKELAIFVIQKSVDTAWVEDQTEKITDKIVELLSNSKGTVSLDLSGTKNILSKVSTGLLVLDNIIPGCKETQNASDNQAGLGKILDARTYCNVKTDLVRIKNSIDKISPGIVNLDSSIKNANSFIENIQHFTSNINFYFWLSLISLIILLGLIVILEFYDLAFMIKSISLALIIASAITFFGGLISKAFISTAYVGVSASITGPIKVIIGDFIAASVAGIFSHLEIISGIIFGVFLIIFIVVIFLQKSGLKLFKHNI